MKKIILTILFLSVTSCAITPNVSLTEQTGFDVRYEKGKIVPQKFFTTIPAMGTYGIVGLKYKF